MLIGLGSDLTLIAAELVAKKCPVAPVSAIVGGMLVVAVVGGEEPDGAATAENDAGGKQTSGFATFLLAPSGVPPNQLLRGFHTATCPRGR